MHRLVILGLLVLSFAGVQSASADDTRETYFLWPDDADGKSTADVGQIQPARENENPPAIRITEIEHPFIKRFDPDPKIKNGSSVILIPGGGYNYDVVGKEGGSCRVAQFYRGHSIRSLLPVSHT